MRNRRPTDDDPLFGQPKGVGGPDPRFLASAEFTIEISSELFGREDPDPDKLIWDRRIELRHRVERQVQQRLALLPYGRHVSFRLRFDRGSIMVMTSFLLIGMTLFDLISKYPDFFEGINLIAQQVRELLFEETENLLASFGIPTPPDSFDVQLVDLATPVLPPRPTRRIRLDLRNLLRFAGILFVALVLLLQFPQIRRILGGLWAYPDLAHEVIHLPYNPSAASLGLVFSNEGLGPAEKVDIQIDTLGKGLVDYRVLCQEAYILEQEDLEAGILALSLERIAPGARCDVLLRSNEDLTASPIFLSATSLQGVSQAKPSRKVDDVNAFLEPQPSGIIDRAILALQTAWSSFSIHNDLLRFGVQQPNDLFLLGAVGMAIAVLVGVIFNLEAFQAFFSIILIAGSILFLDNVPVPAYVFFIILFIMLLLIYLVTLLEKWQAGNLVLHWPGVMKPLRVLPFGLEAYPQRTSLAAKLDWFQVRPVNIWVVLGGWILILLALSLANEWLGEVYLRAPYLVISYVTLAYYFNTKMGLIRKMLETTREQP